MEKGVFIVAHRNLQFMDATAIIPTLNEAGNISILVKELRFLYPGIKIIISDDGSTDGTEEIARQIASESPGKIILIERRGKQKGLTASVIDAALIADTKFIVVMDGDLQHPPEIVGNILDSLLNGADLAVAYRTKVENFGIPRQAMSLTAGTLATLSLRLRGAPVPRDIMSGFFGVKRELFANAIKDNSESFEPAGYKVLFDLLKNLPRKIKLANIPYEFGTRERGTSKIGSRQVLSFLRDLFR